MKLNRSLVLCVVLLLSLSLAIGSTVAYLSDTDEDVNVMTLGNVKIEQVELERVDQSDDKTDTDNLQDFQQDKPLYPYVGTLGWADEAQQWPEGGSSVLFTDEVKNVVDKFVFVKNTGKSDAYVRTWFAFEQGGMTPDEFEKMIGVNFNLDHWSIETVAEGVEIAGGTYLVKVATYMGNAGDDHTVHPNGVLPAGETTRPSLLQVYLNKEAGNEIVEKMDSNGNGKYDIYVVSQAIQKAGFADADAALEAGFGTSVQWIKEAEITPPAVEGETATLTLDGGTVYVASLEEPVEISGSGTVLLNSANVAAGDETPGLSIAPGSKVTLTVNGDSSFTGGTSSDGITVGEGAELVITGTGKLTAIGNGGKEDWNNPNGPSGHGIGGTGDIVIRDLADLDAQGYGKGGTGIGGEASSVTIENTNISNAQGGFGTITWKPTNYGKEAPEGAPGIGSLADNAVISLKDDTIASVKGGSKSAGIGARFWNSVTIDIDNCVIEEVVGGAYGAGIGASRVHARNDGDTRQYVTITINDSKINAQGGLYGAGIGSAYDTHCQHPDVSIMTTIYIKGDSNITAVGGDRAAGIGTGYHSGALAGEIESSVTVNATAGPDPYKHGTYTPAQDVGFGILDPGRSGYNNTYSFNYKGTIITMPDPVKE